MLKLDIPSLLLYYDYHLCFQYAFDGHLYQIVAKRKFQVADSSTLYISGQDMLRTVYHIDHGISSWACLGIITLFVTAMRLGHYLSLMSKVASISVTAAEMK